MNTKNKDTIIAYIDLVNSRNITNRKILNQKSNQILKLFQQLKEKDKKFLAIDVWKGLDEWICTTKNFKSLFYFLLKTQEIIHPFQIRVCIANTFLPKQSKPIHDWDHQVFADLVEAMQDLKNSNLFCSISNKDELKIDHWLELSYNTIYILKNNFTVKQMDLYKLAKEKKQEDVSKKLKVSQQYISKSLKNMQYERISYLENNFLSLLHE